MIHALTIDVEDYYSVVARDWLDRQGPPTQAVVRNTGGILQMLSDAGFKATFFFLGEVVESFPQLVRDVAAQGHEVGVHGHLHRQFFKLTPDQAHEEVGEAKSRLEDLLGHEVLGHRAPAFSIGRDTQWALEVLAELGFWYDSSVFPIAGRRYGWPGFPPDIHEVSLPGGRKIVEAPLSTVRLLGRALPACGGGYLRHFPYAYTRWAMRRIARERPAIVYLHPYEVDTRPGPADFEKAMAAAPKPTRRFHAVQLRNRNTVKSKLDRLLREFAFAPLGQVISAVLSGGHRSAGDGAAPA